MDQSPKSNKPPQLQRSNDPDSGNGFNWKVLLLFGLAIAVLSVAVFRPMSLGSKTLTYEEFKTEFKEGRVYQGENEKQLTLEIGDQTGSSKLRGFLIASQEGKPFATEPHRKLVPFRVNLSLDAVSDPVRDQVLSKLTSNRVEDFPGLAEGAVILSPEELRLEMLRGRVQISNQNEIQFLSKPDGQAIVQGSLIEYQYPELGKESNQAKLIPFVTSVPALVKPDEIKDLLYPNVKEERPSNFGQYFMVYGLPILLIFFIFMMFRSQMRSAGKGAMSFGKSKARLLARERNRVTFADVAGIQEAKEEVTEIVDFLRDPRKFQALGGTIPKGVLMVGGPGTGKTLLARAIAGEADVPFFSISGSDFVEMFVGVGASRVRDMFEQGKKHAPCLIFIDEIDAVGRHRGHGVGGGHDEREQTLNALLVEMDGFDTQEGIIIIAATNRPDVLDPALLRPGRFDRQVTVSLPDVEGRKQILGVHSKKIKLSDKVNLDIIARGTPGFSGAELANLINEAALLAARRNLTEVSQAELEEARDKVRWGRERRSMALSEDEKKTTAYHEAGHALLLAVLTHTNPLHKVTIIPRGPYLGAAFNLPKEDRYHFHKMEGLEQLIVTMGGRVAEEIVFGDVTSGASGDIRQATNLARRMVCEWGMSDELGMIEYGNNREEVFLARDMGSERNYSEATAVRIDSEIKRFVDEAYAEAKRILIERRHQLEAIALGLLEYETLDAVHIHDIINHGKMLNPPQSPITLSNLAPISQETPAESEEKRPEVTVAPSDDDLGQAV